MCFQVSPVPPFSPDPATTSEIVTVRGFYGHPVVKHPPCIVIHQFNPWSGKIPHATEQLSLSVTTSQHSTAYKLQLLSQHAATMEVCMPGKTTAMRSLHPATKSSPCLPQLEKACMQQ